MPGERVTVKFTDDGVNFSKWSIRAGIGEARADYFNTRIRYDTQRTAVIDNLPTDGSEVFLTLHYFDTSWKRVSHRYNTNSTTTPETSNAPPPDPSKPTIQQPLNGSKLVADTTNFVFHDSGLNITKWAVRAGRSDGTADYFNSNQRKDNLRSIKVTNLPTDGSDIFISLHYFTDRWHRISNRYIAKGTSPVSTSVDYGFTNSNNTNVSVTKWIESIGCHKISRITGTTNLVGKSNLALRLSSAGPGDVIRLRNGTYSNLGNVNLNVPGVSLAAQTPGGVVISGKSRFRLLKNNQSLEGLVFKDTIGDVIEITASNSLINNNRFIRTNRLSKKVSSTLVLLTGANDAEISNNHFDNTYWVDIAVSQENPVTTKHSNYQSVKRPWIHNNCFTNKQRRVSNGGEAIHLGTGWSASQARKSARKYNDSIDALIENNVFLNSNGDSELISVKSSRNTIRYNYIRRSEDETINIRKGNRNLVYANYYDGGRGTAFQISGDNNTFVYNYVNPKKNGGFAMILHNEELYRPPAPTGIYNSYWAANRTRMLNNILLNHTRFIRVYPNLGYLKSQPRGGVFSCNILVQGSLQYVDDSKSMPESTFKSRNRVSTNNIIVSSINTAPACIRNKVKLPGGLSASQVSPPVWWNDVLTK